MSLASLVQCEWLKLRNSKMILVSILGAMVTPFMILVGMLKERMSDPEYQVTYYTVFDQSNFYMILLFGLVVYTVFAAFLFSREYSENTLKMIVTIPVSRVGLLISKFIVLLIWCTLLSLLSWIFCFVIASITKATQFSTAILFKSIIENMLATAILVFLLTPLIFLSIYTKGIVIPVIASATLLMMNAALSNEELAALFPWSAIYMVATNRVEETGYSIELSVLIIIITSIIGMILSIWYFGKNDIK